ncbi:hypothetical protein CAP36_13205 [Chitinophagaceae bacterium IBVUCB2]|nr:hypothetical protein CAP36_13205 [Chitinophagaceae bacterium IBVUCB2]
MSQAQQIQYLTNRKIDKTKWDNCISKADNGLIYAYSFYLDTMAKHWDALVLNDYEVVMPLTWNSKYGINYLYQPFLAAQLGIFGNNISEELIEDFIHSIPTSFRLIEISLNSKNITGIPTGYAMHRSNYTLDLNKPYNTIYSNYKENIRRNIKKATQLGCIVEKEVDVEEVITLAVQQMKEQSNESSDNINRFRKLYKFLNEKKMAAIYGIKLNNELLASCVFFYSHHRAYYILVGNHPNGKTIGASHFLIDAFIKDNADKEMLLDFEGSDIPSLAFFYSSFGAVHEIYPALKINRLPFYLKWLKR